MGNPRGIGGPLEDALVDLASTSTIVDRKSRLESLVRIARGNVSGCLDRLDSKAWRRLFDTLFQMIQVDKADYYGSKSHRGRAEHHLINGASAIRALAELAVHRVKIGPAACLLRHITETLPVNDGLCEPIAIDCLRAMRCTLERQAHAEHLRDCWQSTFAFCVDSLNCFQAPLRNSSSGYHSSIIPQSGEESARKVSSRHEADELVTCIKLLSVASNALVRPLSARATDCLVDYLELITSYGRSHLDAMTGINHILERVSQSNIVLTCTIVRRLMRTIPRLWAFKSNQLRDEVLRFLIITRLHIHSIFQGTADESFVAEVAESVAAILDDYSQRASRDQLHLQDIDLSSEMTAPHTQAWTSARWRLRFVDFRAEANLSTVYFLAYLTMLMDMHNTRKAHQRRHYQQDNPKRARIPTHLEQLMRSSHSASSCSQTCTLQILTMRAMLKEVDPSELEQLVAFALVHAASSISSIASWAILLLTSCVKQSSSSMEHLSTTWQQVWQLACGAMTNPSNCRAACFLLAQLVDLGTVDLSSVTASLDSMLHMPEIAGPSILEDTSIDLWLKAATKKVTSNPSSATNLSSKLLQWLFNKWNPSAFSDRLQVLNDVRDPGASSILRFIQFCIGHELIPERMTEMTLPRGSVEQAWCRHIADVNLLQYLLMPLDQQASAPRKVATLQSALSLRVGRDDFLDAMVLEYCLAEASKTIDRFRNLAEDGLLGISNLSVWQVTHQCLVYDYVRAHCFDASGVKKASLNVLAHEVTMELVRYLSRAETEQSKLDTCLYALADLVPMSVDLKSEEDDRIFKEESHFLAECSRVFEQEKRVVVPIMTGHASILMDLDDGFESQNSDVIAQVSIESLPRDIVSTKYDKETFRKNWRYRLLYISRRMNNIQHESSIEVSSQFLVESLDFASHDFCLCWGFVRTILLHAMTGKWAPLSALFQHIIRNFMECYAYETHEAALAICVDLLQLTAGQWSASADDEANERPRALFEWFVTTAIEDSLVSNAVEVDIAQLCRQLLQLRGPSFKLDPASNDLREQFIRFLDRDLPVMYHISHELPALFHHYAQGQHEAILDAIWTRLPVDPDNHERMGLRLHVFAKLAAKWQTLLRRCVYHVFETAGKFPSTTDFAKAAVTTIANVLAVKDETEIFVIFASQLLYSWLAEQKISTIPFQIFGFQNLEALLTEVDDEVLAQILMRGDDGHLSEVRDTIGITDEIMVDSFSRAAAYCLTQDSENKRKGHKNSNLEARLVQLTGDKRFLRLFQSLHPQILASVLLSLNTDTEEKLLKSFQTHEKMDLLYAREALMAMRSMSGSTLLLPPDQQPVFHGKDLVDTLYKILRRSGRSLEHLWSPPIYVFVLRTMLRRLHPALGSLHACSVVRKIRVLIALSSKSITAGYALEMTMHAMRPLLGNHQCSNDVSGIMQYLFDSAKPGLAKVLPFTSGLLVAVLMSLQNLLVSQQDSTTQDSDHQNVVQRAANFRQWLAKSWWPDLESIICKRKVAFPNIGDLQSLVLASISSRMETSAQVLTPESDLLRLLLNQGRSHSRFLSTTTQRSLLKQFCDHFHCPESFRSDLFGADNTSVAYASAVWQFCSTVSLHRDDFLLWTGKLLGRAHMAKHANDVIISAHDTARLTEKSSGEDMDALDLGKSSKLLILNDIVGLLSSQDTLNAGLAEDALRTLIRINATTGAMEQPFMDLPSTLLTALQLDIDVPSIKGTRLPVSQLETVLYSLGADPEYWSQQLVLSIIDSSNNRFLHALSSVFCQIQALALKLLPAVIHLALCQELDTGAEVLKQQLSERFCGILDATTSDTIKHSEVIVQVVLYLRQKSHPSAAALDAKNAWIELDMAIAATAAERCGMHSTALMFAESTLDASSTLSRSQRRASSAKHVSNGSRRHIPHELLLSIYRSIDEPDSFYGVHQSASLKAVRERLDYEHEGYKSLLFHNAKLQSTMRQGQDIHQVDSLGVVEALSRLNLNIISHAVLQNQQKHNSDAASEVALSAARKLEQWDINIAQTSNTDSATLYRVFQGMHSALQLDAVKQLLNSTIITETRHLLQPIHDHRARHKSLCVLAVLTEIDEVISATSYADCKAVLNRMRARDVSLASAHASETSRIHSSRGTLFNVLAQNASLQTAMNLTPKDARSVQVYSLLDACKFAERQEVSNESLTTATYLADLIPVCRSVGLNIEFQAQETIADILWAQGEETTSIHMLEALVSPGAKSKVVAEDITRATVSAKLGYRIGQARLETSTQIIHRYLSPALNCLNGQYKGEKAGRVLHEFAAFCDRELHNAEIAEEYKRITATRARRKQEVELHNSLARSAKNKEDREKLTRDAKIAARWFKIDSEEFERVTAAREVLIQQCVENYVRSLAAGDDNDSDVLRLFSIWLEFSQDGSINQIIAEQAHSIPSSKFALLMSQLTSLLQADKTVFASNLKALILRICLEHPHHAFHHIFATLNNNQQSDDSSLSRRQAAGDIVASMKADDMARDLWNRYWQAGTMYHALAIYTDRSKISSGKEIALDRILPSATLAAKIKALRVPPATLDVALRKDRDYSAVPTTTGFKPKMTIASGISAPKILTAIASNGRTYKQLHKAGNDDLRQDAIMEQVFDQVSQLLKKHAPTRQRRLQIRTYRVLPLSGHSGIIEFVPNTLPLSDYLQPAHQRYYPEDWSWSRCREKLHSIAQQTTDARSKLNVFKEIEANFHPVLRQFFLERFTDPDEWFQRRLAYTRSTAAISMLGHVLGLGDRHCHNILLDQKSGEAVHIDLGIAFEAGRILPVPEVVPFRLSRDIVDGFGITKTEGVFRRCCKFTLDALRDERESIMTLLNVLRYDPLVNWTVSPLRAKRLQSEEPGFRGFGGPSSGVDNTDEGPAGRALGVVEKKLTQMMSTAAIVSELIQQASDERNLAVLYSGWAPWA